MLTRIKLDGRGVAKPTPMDRHCHVLPCNYFAPLKLISYQTWPQRAGSITHSLDDDSPNWAKMPTK
jgi:hypothetical protein